MKKSLVIGTVLLIVMVLSVTSIAGAKSAATPNRGMFTDAATMGIRFDGYCDGVTLTLNPTNGVVTDVLNSTCASCPFTDVGAGTLGVVRNQGLGSTIAWQTNWGGNPPWSWTLIRANHTWTHYYFDGSVLNAGTWSECVETAQSTGKTPSGLR